MDSGCVAGIARRQTHPAPRVGSHESRYDSERCAAGALVCPDLEGSGGEDQQVGGSGHIRRRGMKRDVDLEAARAARRSSRQIDRDQWVVDQVRPDTGQVDDGRDVERSQLVGGADTRAGEDHGAGIGSCCEHHAVGFDDSSVQKADPRRTHPRALDVCHHSVWTDGEVRPRPRRGEVGDGGAHTHTIAGVARCRSRTDRPRPVVVVDIAMTRGDRAIQERGLDGVQLLPEVSANRDQTVRPVQ